MQRWEREEGLPVHRHRHDKQGSIYAFRGELDAWWTARGPALADGEHDVAAAPPVGSPTTEPPARVVSVQPRSPREPWFTRRRSALLGAGMLTTLIAVSLWARPTELPPHVALHRVLITEVENHTPEPALSDRLRDAVQEQLSAARLANIVPAEQSAAFLRLMRQPATARIDAAIGREIALRDGSIHAVVTGVLDRLDTKYAATIRVLSPVDDAVLATFRASGATAPQLLDAVRREIAAGARTLDAALPHQHRPPLPRVTTRSLRALQLYGEAVNLMDQVPIKTGPAFELLTEATRLDPGFASAHILAAWSQRNARRPQDAVLPHAERAFSLADTTSDAERYFILGSYYQLKLEVEKAIAAYEALLHLDPAHYWTLGNLSRLYRAVGRHDAASELRARQVTLRPKQFWGNFRLAESLFLRGDLQGAEDYAMRAASQVADVDPGDLQSRRSWLEILPACKAWLRDDAAASVQILERLEATLSRRQGADREALTTSSGYMYLALGQRAAAERLFERLPGSAERLYHLAVVGAHFGDQHPVTAYFSAAPASPGVTPATHGLPSADTRLAARAGHLVGRWEPALDAADAKLLRGQVALMQRRFVAARALLAESIALREDRFGAPALAAAAGIAYAWRGSGDRAQAIHAVEEASQNRYRSCLWPIANAHLWVRLRAELARLYREAGRDDEALDIEAHLRIILRAADDDLPLRASLAPVSRAEGTR